jgi:hypothetical protein
MSETPSADQDEFNNLCDTLTEPSPREEAFFADRRRKGIGVGLDENGDLIRHVKSPLISD